MNITGFKCIYFRFLDTRCEESWTIDTIVLSCMPFPPPHTAVNSLQLIKDVLHSFDIPMESISTSTQDTTASSINVFRDVDEVQQMKCACHLLHNMVQRIYDESPAILAIYEAMHKITVKLGGSPKRISILKKHIEAKGKLSHFQILFFIVFIFNDFYFFRTEVQNSSAWNQDKME